MTACFRVSLYATPPPPSSTTPATGLALYRASTASGLECWTQLTSSIQRLTRCSLWSPVRLAATTTSSGTHTPLAIGTPRGATRVAKRWAEITAGMAPGATEPEARMKQLQRHRDDVLRASPRSQWLSRKKRIEAEQREVQSSAEERWSDAYDRATALEEALLEAEFEQAAARAARMTPAATSAAVRAQRERVEAATMEVVRLTV